MKRYNIGCLTFHIYISKDYSILDEVIEVQQDLLEQINGIRKNQLKRLKKEGASTKNSMLYIGVLHETKNLILYLVNLLKAHRDFVNYSNNKSEVIS